MPKRLLALSLTLAALLEPAVAAAQPADQCWDTPDNGTRKSWFNAAATQNWQDSRQRADPGVMARMAGIYYGEIVSPQGDMVSRQYRRFSPDGLFDYQDQTCGNIAGIACSQNQGTGSWTAHQQPDGSIFVMVNFSDMVRTSQCFSDTVAIGNGGFQSISGAFWRRTQ